MPTNTRILGFKHAVESAGPAGRRWKQLQNRLSKTRKCALVPKRERHVPRMLLVVIRSAARQRLAKCLPARRWARTIARSIESFRIAGGS